MGKTYTQSSGSLFLRSYVRYVWVAAILLLSNSNIIANSYTGKGYDLTYQQDTIKPIDNNKPTPPKIVRVIGIVNDEKRTPLHKASVVVMGTHKGTYTDEDGKFEILTESNKELIVTYTGRIASIVRVKEYIEGTVLNVELTETQRKEYDEVIVTGYQRTSTKMVSGSIVTLSPDKFLTPGVANLDGMLQGKVAGLNIMNSSGSATSSPSVRIRGTSTFVGSAEPLWVVDGIIREDITIPSSTANALLSDASSAGSSIVGNSIAGVNPEDVESVTFLKDAASTAIYGTRASNGVIVVTTKKGKAAAKPLISFSSTFGITQRPTYDKLNRMDSKQRINVAEEMMQNGYSYDPSALINPNTYEYLYTKYISKQISFEEFQQASQKLQTMNTDWMDVLFQNAFNQNYSLSMSGGAAKSSYYASLSYTDSKGSTIGDEAKRYQASIRLASELTKRLRSDFKLQGSVRKANGFFSINPYDYAYNTSRTVDPNIYYPTRITTMEDDAQAALVYKPLMYNFLNEKAHTSNTDNGKSVDAMLDLKYNIIKGLDFDMLLGFNYTNNENIQWADEQSFYVAQIRKTNFGEEIVGKNDLPFGGVLAYKNNNTSAYTVRPTVNYLRTFFEGHHTLQATAGAEIHSATRSGFYDTEYGYFPDRGNRVGYNYGDTANFSSSSLGKHSVGLPNGLDNTLSGFVIGGYNINNKYLINGSIRVDASNRFGQNSNNKFLPIYSISGKWSIAEEAFLKNVRAINMLNLRASYGIQGNVVKSVGPDLIVSYPSTPVDPLTRQYYLNLVSLAYPDLRWEKTATTNIGLDASFLENRLRITVDFYNKKGSDLLLANDVPYETGLSNMFYNGGSMLNRGFEFMVDVTPVKTTNWKWNLSFNGAANKNIATSQQTIASSNGSNLVSGYLNGNMVIEGKPINAIYSYDYAGLNHNNGVPMYNFATDPSGKGLYDPSVWLSYSGKKIPSFTGGVQTTLQYKAFNLTAMFVYVTGNVKRLNPLYSYTGPMFAPTPEKNLSSEFADRWRQPGDEAKTNIPSLTTINLNDQTVKLPLLNPTTGNAYAMYDKSNARIVSGNFLRCTNLVGGYTLPPTVLNRYGIKTASVNLMVSNLFVIASKKLNGQDPETTGFGGSSLPMLTSYTLGLKLSF